MCLLFCAEMLISPSFPAGFSSSTEAQLKQVLEVVGSALKAVKGSHSRDATRDAARAEIIERRKATQNATRASTCQSTVSEKDGVSESEVTSEFGVGDERIAGSEPTGEGLPAVPAPPSNGLAGAVDDLPIVVIKNYALRGEKRDELLTVLANWSAALVENKVKGHLVCQDYLEDAFLNVCFIIRSHTSLL